MGGASRSATPARLLKSITEVQKIYSSLCLDIPWRATIYRLARYDLPDSLMHQRRACNLYGRGKVLSCAKNTKISDK